MVQGGLRSAWALRRSTPPPPLFASREPPLSSPWRRLPPLPSSPEPSRGDLRWASPGASEPSGLPGAGLRLAALPGGGLSGIAATPDPHPPPPLAVCGAAFVPGALPRRSAWATLGASRPERPPEGAIGLNCSAIVCACVEGGGGVLELSLAPGVSGSPSHCRDPGFSRDASEQPDVIRRLFVCVLEAKSHMQSPPPHTHTYHTQARSDGQELGGSCGGVWSPLGCRRLWWRRDPCRRSDHCVSLLDISQDYLPPGRSASPGGKSCFGEGALWRQTRLRPLCSPDPPTLP